MNRRVRLVQLDGKLPNLALMKLAHWHRSQGDEVQFTRSIQPTLFDPDQPDVVYGSAIFRRSKPLVRQLREAYPDAITGGTGTWDDPDGTDEETRRRGSRQAVWTNIQPTQQEMTELTVEEHLGVESYEHYDYSIYPEYRWSMGFTQRGCRLKRPFCVVPRKEGRPRPVNTIPGIWRPGTEKKILLLDNDFFGQPETEWRSRIAEIREGGFRINITQGINIRTITEETAAAIASVGYYDHRFNRRRLYTAWDTLGHEKAFFRGLDRLERAGVPARHLMVYTLTGYDPDETMEQVLYRYRKLTERGCRVFPMVYGEQPARRTPGELRRPGST